RRRGETAGVVDGSLCLVEARELMVRNRESAQTIDGRVAAAQPPRQLRRGRIENVLPLAARDKRQRAQLAQAPESVVVSIAEASQRRIGRLDHSVEIRMLELRARRAI